MQENFCFRRAIVLSISNGGGKVESSPQRLGLPPCFRAIHNYPLPVTIPPPPPQMWGNYLASTCFLESASSVTELQLTTIMFQGVPQFETSPGNEPIPKGEHNFPYLGYTSQLSRQFVQGQIFEADVSFICI